VKYSCLLITSDLSVDMEEDTDKLAVIIGVDLLMKVLCLLVHMLAEVRSILAVHFNYLLIVMIANTTDDILLVPEPGIYLIMLLGS
jgi:hypothetical protein